MDKNVIISVKTILITFLFAIGAYVIYKLSNVFAILFVALLLVLALEPLVLWFKKQTVFKHQINRGFAVIATYLIFISAVALIFTVGLPPAITQIQSLLTSLNTVIAELKLPVEEQINLTTIIPQFSSISKGVVGIVSSGFSTVTTIFSLFMISLYMSLDWENLKRRFIAFFPNKDKLEILRIIQDVEANVGNWVKGQMILMAVIGSLSFVGMAVLGIKYAVALGLLAGLLEAVPILGPVLTAVVAAAVAFMDAPIKAVAVIILFIIIQQLENNLLVPKIMQKVSGFSPLAILIALLVGSTFFGVVGTIVAIPTLMIAVIVIKNVLRAGSK
ncbi:MAG: protein of unknown function UPF0118 [uncultured bacterium]|nr:MAG: protein of unknown function UPF0118 [uncultured bacterium]